jgi:hypothetical protein
LLCLRPHNVCQQSTQLLVQGSGSHCTEHKCAQLAVRACIRGTRQYQALALNGGAVPCTPVPLCPA